MEKSQERKKNKQEPAAGEEKFDLHLGTQEERKHLKSDRRMKKDRAAGEKIIDLF